MSYYYPPTVSGPLCQQDVYDDMLAAGKLRECQVCGNLLDPDPDLVCECGEETVPNPNYCPPEQRGTPTDPWAAADAAASANRAQRQFAADLTRETNR